MKERFGNVFIDELKEGDIYTVKGMYDLEPVEITEKGKTLKDGYESFDGTDSNLDIDGFTGTAYKVA